MTDKPELLPCPFCGGEAIKKSGYYGSNTGGIYSQEDYWEVFGCIKCDIYRKYKTWNTRAPLGVTKAEAVEMLNDMKPECMEDWADYYEKHHIKLRRLLEAAAQQHQ